MVLEDVKKSMTREDELAKYEGSDRVISSKDFKERLKKEKALYNFSSGIPGLDKLINGFETGELIILTGWTKHGKTSFLQTLTTNFAEKDLKCLWFSFEMPPRQFFLKFPEDPPLFYLPSELRSGALQWVEDRIIEAKIKFDIRIVFIDHLHYLWDIMQKYAKSSSLELGVLIRGLKGIAIQHNLVIFLVAHTMKPSGIYKGEEPGLESIRDSSFITQESDSAMAITRIRPKGSSIYSNECWLTVLTHRRSGIMGRRIKLLYANNHFFEVNEQDEQF